MDGQITIFDYCDSRLKKLKEQYPIPKLSKEILSEEGWVDDWHYCEIETPEEVGVYFTISELPNSEYWSYTYRAWAFGKWWWWDGWRHSFFPEKERRPFAWVRIPSMYLQKDKSLKERLGLEGIVKNETII